MTQYTNATPGSDSHELPCLASLHFLATRILVTMLA